VIQQIIQVSYSTSTEMRKFGSTVILMSDAENLVQTSSVKMMMMVDG
jgi:hypothetical protein